MWKHHATSHDAGVSNIARTRARVRGRSPDTTGGLVRVAKGRARALRIASASVGGISKKSMRRERRGETRKRCKAAPRRAGSGGDARHRHSVSDRGLGLVGVPVRAVLAVVVWHREGDVLFAIRSHELSRVE